MPTRIALVGDRSAHVVAYGRITEILGRTDDVEGYWIGTPEVEAEEIAQFDGVWAVPGSPYADERGMVTAIRVARELEIPFLGTCGGFQHALIEYARNVAGQPDAWHAENRDDALDADALVVPLACSLVGHENDVALVPNTIAAVAAGRLRLRERFHCSFGLVPGADERLEAAGLVISGRDPDGEVRICELTGHPFYLATLFQPELADEQPHPFVSAFLDAARLRAATGRGALAAAPAG